MTSLTEYFHLQLHSKQEKAIDLIQLNVSHDLNGTKTSEWSCLLVYHGF